ncbi:MAG: oligosaccharide flippase family protein [Phycisphaerales bacterium]|nr:oligosaccharide flippase family protein [Phycisphaerales bacterium]
MSSNAPHVKSLGHAVGHGLIWMLLATIVAKGASFVAQIVLGILLLKEDFGVYALAVSVTVVVQVIRDGGARKVLVQKGVRRFDKLICPVFWMALCFNVVSALIMIGIAPLAARFYDQPDLVPMLMVIALGTLISTHGTMYRAKLAAELRYSKLARFRSTVVILRNLSMIVFALLGFGAMSFAWPFVVISVAEWALGLWMCGRLNLLRTPRLRLWPKLFGVSVWMLVSTLALAVVNQGPYAIVGYYVPAAVLGVYYFASQLVLQINLILAVNLQDVLLPALSSLNASRERQNNAVVRTVRMLAFSSSGAAFGVATIAPEVEHLFWGSKWEEAIPAIQWMCVFIPFRMLQSVIEPALLAQSNYKLNAWLLWIQAAIIAAFSLAGGLWLSEPWEFSASVGAGYAVSIVVAGVIGCEKMNISWWKCVGGFLPSWIVGIGCLLVVLWVKSLVPTPDEQTRVSAAVLMVLGGGAFALLFALVSRFTLRNLLSESLGVLPGRVRRVARRAVLLPAS